MGWGLSLAAGRMSGCIILPEYPDNRQHPLPAALTRLRAPADTGLVVGLEPAVLAALVGRREREDLMDLIMMNSDFFSRHEVR